MKKNKPAVPFNLAVVIARQTEFRDEMGNAQDGRVENNRAGEMYDKHGR